MASFVNAADVVAAAVEIERRGHTFYMAAQQQATTKEDKDFFGFMAQEEQRHEAIFAAMLKRMGGLTLPTGSDTPEYLDYVNILLDSHCLFMPEEQILLKTNPIMQAMHFEKDTILFFLAMMHLVPASEGPQITACVDEEKKHLKMLAEYRDGTLKK